MNSRLLSLISIGIASSLGAALADENWPSFRGPSEQGLTGEGTKLPVKFSETENVVWKTEVAGKAWSSPVIWGDKIWLTNADEAGTTLSVVAVDKNTGRILHDKVVRRVAEPQFCHKFNSYGSPSPVIEEGRVYVTFGSPWVGCLDSGTGEVLWERTDQVCNHFRGAGSSPFLYGNLLILHYDGSDFQYVMAFDKITGKTVWKTDRSTDFADIDAATGKPEAEGDWRKAYSTPRVLDTGNGRIELISLGSKALFGYEPETGKELWKVEAKKMHSAGCTPALGHGLIFAPMGSGGELYAVKPGGSGIVTDSHIAWKYTRVVPKRPSVLVLGDLLFMIDDGGVAACLEAKTGTEIWRDRVGGNYSSSPVHADGKIWFFDEDGKSTVIEAGREFKILAENHLDAGTMASPAVSGNALFVRTKTHLYRIEEKP
ncbi:MAG: PQQ-binding-like beta-propeller repeat protein [Verrucomicrobiales bacterium]|nr:PQQ-binding-like beta-propeller repeat protein [Verrucomicrobiales bacterium]